MGDRTERTRIIIQPGMRSRHYWRELWRHRELFYFLAWRDILVRYKQTALGISWSVLRPLVTMLAFTLVFGRLAGLPSHGTPYPVMILSALLPWQFFASAFSEGSASLVDNAGLLTKTYFPRMIVPAGAMIVSLVDFLLSLCILFAIMAWFGVSPSIQLIVLPLILLVAAVTSLGVALWLSALNVRYRDFRHAVPFLAQVGLYVSPVGFSSSIVPEQWRPFFYLNPMAGVIDGFRWSILGDAFPVNLPGMAVSLTVAGFLLFSGMAYFRSVEHYFADVV